MINAGLSAAAELIPGAISAVLVGSDGGRKFYKICFVFDNICFSTSAA